LRRSGTGLSLGREGGMRELYSLKMLEIIIVLKTFLDSTLIGRQGRFQIRDLALGS